MTINDIFMNGMSGTFMLMRRISINNFKKPVLNLHLYQSFAVFTKISITPQYLSLYRSISVVTLTDPYVDSIMYRTKHEKSNSYPKIDLRVVFS